ncbi:MAG: oxaloacetate decarboxylase [Acidimicrobiia bacterium]
MGNPRAALRQLIGGDPFIAADCYSALSARIVEFTGFKACYMGGHATSMMHYAIPDNGSYTPTEAVDQAARVAEAVQIPVVADADQAGESVADVYRTIRRFERVGVAGVHIEDEKPPKHSSLAGPLLSPAEMAARISAAADARVDADFVIIARSDEFYVEGGGGSGSLDVAIERGKAYAAAGADVFLPTFATAEQVEAIAREVAIPIATYGPLMPHVAFSLFTGWGTAAAAREHMKWAKHLLDNGELPPEAYGFDNKDELIGQGFYDDLIRTWATKSGYPTR